MSVKVQLERTQPIWLQIGDQIRKQILNGVLAPGTKLPPTAEMAKLSGTDIKTMQRALSGLVKEGLLTRARKLGTHVAKRPPTLPPLGIYYHVKLSPTSNNIFIHLVHEALQQEIHEHDIPARLWIDRRPLQDSPLPELTQAIREGQLRGLISTIVDLDHAWMRNLSVPVVCIGSDLPSSVNYDILQFFTLALENLRGQGCRSVGIITPFYRSGGLDVFDKALRCAKKLDLETREEWLYPRTERHPKHFIPDVHEDFGYQGARELLSQERRADGLVIYPDTVARGSILGLMSLQARVPEELRLVLHRNEGNKYFCPLPATYILSGIREFAQALISQMDRLLQGQPTGPIFVSHYLETDTPISREDPVASTA